MENSPETQSNKWLIIFLIYADFTTKKDADDIQKLIITLNNMLSDIVTTPIVPEQSRMFVIMNSIKFVFNDPQNGIDDKCAFYTIERTLDGTQNYIANCEIIDSSTYYIPDEHGGQVLQKPLQLKSVLEKTCIMADEEVFLITWDHGSSFGMFRAEPPATNVVSVRNEVETDLPLYPYLKMFWDKAEESHKETRNQNSTAIGLIPFRCPEWKKPRKAAKNLFVNQQSIQDQPASAVAEILKNSELNKALRAWLRRKDRKVAVLLMTNCWMMNLHTMYALRNSVRCLVAPQGSIDCPGYNFRDILIKISKSNTTGLQPTELAKTCVETIDNEYSKGKAQFLMPSEPDVIKRFKIFAVDLSKITVDGNSFNNQINNLSSLIDLLNLELKKKELSKKRELKYYLKYVRSACFDFSFIDGGSVKMIDIITWAQSLIFINSQLGREDKKLAQLLINPFQALIDSVLLDENSIILASSKGEKVYYAEHGDQIQLPAIGSTPTGYSLFFPIADCSSSPDFAKLKDNVLSDELLGKLRNWRRFLKVIDPKIDNIFKPILS